MGAWESFGSFLRVFFLVPAFPGVWECKACRQICSELTTKHEALLKPSQEERPKTSLTPISLIEKVEQSLDGLRKRVTPRCKGDI